MILLGNRAVPREIFLLVIAEHSSEMEPVGTLAGTDLFEFAIDVMLTC